MVWSRNPDPFLRFHERIIKNESGCWLWQGNLNTHGYALFKINARSVQVHRWAYETFIGCIPEGFVIDHQCRNRSCVNPEHLEAVTVKENNARSRTCCSQAGHPFTAENSIITKTGARLCRTCQEDRTRKYWSRSNQLRQGLQGLAPEASAMKSFLVFVPNAFDESLLVQELEKLKQRGLILSFSEM